MKEYLSKTLPGFYARIRQPYPKRSGCTDLMIGSTKAHSIMPRTSAFIGINVAKQTPVERFSYAVSNVHLVLRVTRHALISKENDVTGWTRLLTFVTDVLMPSQDVL